MLRERQSTNVVLRPTDLKAYVATEHISRVLHAGSAVEYWKSAPYLLNFMDGYKLTREFEKIDRRTSEWHQIQPILESRDGLLDWADYVSYSAIDPENARLRSLITEMVDSGLWRLLWLPPSLPYYELCGPFEDLPTADLTKRLVFSAWNVVPKVIASLTSYEAERRMMTINGRRAKNSPKARKRIKPLLQVKRAGDDFSGLSALTLLYPSPTLARLGDPREIARSHQSANDLVTRDTVLETVRDQISVAMEPLVVGAPTDGKEDERWYWLSPLLLDHQAGEMEPWFEQSELAEIWSRTDESETDAGKGDHTAFADALVHARNLATQFEEAANNGGLRPLGKTPDDLADVLAEIAVGAPGNTALRAMSRVTGGTQLYADTAVRNGAARTAWSFRRLFNLTDVMTLLRGLDGEGPYWRQVLRYCINGDLQASLDEYAHVLRDWLGIVDGDGSTSAFKIALEMQNAIGLRSAGYVAREVGADGNTDVEYRLRSRFATRFGSDRSDDENELRRASTVRGAFNSPFWPFVLATTSIGQEGLDFHLYCHAVVHWNLPANPVDLEQREGRIHRYKGHAVRKNVALAYRDAAMESHGDPWAAA
ncbi:MAG: helicase-related protein, partial [Actinomycetota bacterium]|nr:helicase-related protein [Actinomycetota bacterium]